MCLGACSRWRGPDDETYSRRSKETKHITAMDHDRAKIHKCIHDFFTFFCSLPLFRFSSLSPPPSPIHMPHRVTLLPRPAPPSSNGSFSIPRGCLSSRGGPRRYDEACCPILSRIPYRAIYSASMANGRHVDNTAELHTLFTRVRRVRASILRTTTPRQCADRSQSYRRRRIASCCGTFT